MDEQLENIMPAATPSLHLKKHNGESICLECWIVWLVVWQSGRTLVFDRKTFLVLRLTCSSWVTIYVGKPSAVGQPTRPTQPFILSG